MSTKQKLTELIGFTPPNDLVRIVDAFTNRAGDFQQGRESLETVLNLGSGIGSCRDGRGYESTPVEFFPFMYTGGDGESYGHVISAPELKLPDWPMGGLVPGESDGVVHIGDSTTAALENIVSTYMHYGDGPKPVDLAFLRQLGLSPSPDKADNVRKLEGDTYIRPCPALPDGWKLEMTSDGVGVVAEVPRFRPGKSSEWTFDTPLADFLK